MFSTRYLSRNDQPQKMRVINEEEQKFKTEVLRKQEKISKKMDALLNPNFKPMKFTINANSIPKTKPEIKGKGNSLDNSLANRIFMFFRSILYSIKDNVAGATLR